MEENSNSQKIIKGVSSQTVVTIVLGVVEMLSFSIMSRLLTQEDFGYYAAITAITSVFACFSDAGIGSAIVQCKQLDRRFINNAFSISLLLGGFISLLLFSTSGPIAVFVADKSMQRPLMLLSVTLLLQCLTSVNTSLMHRKLQFLRIGMINLFSLVVTTIVAVVLAYFDYGYYAIITKAVLGSVISYFLTLYFCKTRFSFALDKESFGKIFSFSGWLLASSLFRNLAHQVEKLLMPRLLSVSALGAYNRPKDFVEQISSRLNGIFDSALFPVLSGLQDNISVLNSAYRRSLYIMNMFASLLTLSFIFNSGLLIRIFFGEQWLHLQVLMIVISSTLLFNIDGRLSDCYLRSLAMTKQQFYFRVFETVIKTVGVLIGFHWDILGVAVSIVITNFISKLIKILYIGIKVNVVPRQAIMIILSSWRYMVVLLPVCIVSFVLLPNTWSGNIALAGIFLVFTIGIFVFFPDFVGKQYKEEVFLRFLPVVKRFLHLG